MYHEVKNFMKLFKLNVIFLRLLHLFSNSPIIIVWKYSYPTTITNNQTFYRIFCNKRPGAMHFSKGGATITDK